MKSLMKISVKWRNVLTVLLFLFTVHLPQFTLAAENYKAGDKLYVAPTTGLNVRNFPDIKAPILTNLDFNTVVTIVADLLPAKPFGVKVTDFNSGKLSLQGHWIKVRTGKITGYIFDGMLSKFKGLQLRTYEDEPYYTALFGKPSLQTVKKSTVIQGRNIDYETEIKSYPRGMVMESTFLDDCYKVVYTFAISFNEAYWLIERMMLDADAAQDIKIKKEKTKTVLNFYSCT